MTRKHFTIFVEVCRFLNFSQAAEALNTTQPAVSLAVKELESHYGVALFERMNRRVYLTPAGEALLATAQDVLRGFQEAEETLGQGRPLALRVGANVSFWRGGPGPGSGALPSRTPTSEAAGPGGQLRQNPKPAGGEPAGCGHCRRPGGFGKAAGPSPSIKRTWSWRRPRGAFPPLPP